MDINFSLVLVIAFFVTGISWLLCKLKVSFANSTFEFFGSLFSVIAVVLVLRSFLFEPFQIPSGSMIPTLKVGDFILVNKYSYGLRLPLSGTKVIPVSDPKRGDVMVFIPPHKSQHYIKRVVGLPGDTVEMRNGVLYVNGEEMLQKPLEGGWQLGDPFHIVQTEQLGDVEHAIRRKVSPSPVSQSYSKQIPEGYYCMIGDNRDNSRDSREWGLVPEKNIVGKAVAVWMHWDKFLSWPDFSQARSIK